MSLAPHIVVIGIMRSQVAHNILIAVEYINPTQDLNGEAAAELRGLLKLPVRAPLRPHDGASDGEVEEFLTYLCHGAGKRAPNPAHRLQGTMCGGHESRSRP